VEGDGRRLDLEPARERLIWRGTGSTRIREQRSTQDRIDTINEAVEKILERFPPGQK